jgi:DNA-binding response OmpR family regulator
MLEDEGRPEHQSLLLASGDAALVQAMGPELRAAGFSIRAADSREGALALLAEERFALLLLDAELSRFEAFALCAEIRARTRTPIIVVSAHPSETEVVQALSAGADDVLATPFSARALIARIEAILRRAHERVRSAMPIDDGVLDLDGKQLTLGGAQLRLTALETVLLRELLDSPGRAVSIHKLSLAAWGRAGRSERHALKQVIYRLRRKLQALEPLSGRLQSVRSVGYRWSAEAAPSSPRALDRESRAGG